MLGIPGSLLLEGTMAIRAISRKAMQSQIDWPTVGITGSMAGIFVICLTLTAWVAERGFPLPRSGFVASATRSVGEVRSHAERGNEECGDGVENDVSDASQQVAVYPERDISREVFSGPKAENKGKPEAARQALSAAGARPQAVSGERQAAKQEAVPEACCQVEFARDPAEAALLAKKERKLMFVLHVSGNFEESKFT
jgi:hypothetical protein